MKAILIIMLTITTMLVGCTTFDNSEGDREQILDELILQEMRQNPRMMSLAQSWDTYVTQRINWIMNWKTVNSSSQSIVMKWLI